MLHLSRRAATINECLDAVRLTQDPARLHEVPAAKLVSAAAACAKTLERVSEATEHLERRSSALHVIDRARRLLRRELQRREPHKGH